MPEWKHFWKDIQFGQEWLERCLWFGIWNEWMSMCLCVCFVCAPRARVAPGWQGIWRRHQQRGAPQKLLCGKLLLIFLLFLTWILGGGFSDEPWCNTVRALRSLSLSIILITLFCACLWFMKEFIVRMKSMIWIKKLCFATGMVFCKFDHKVYPFLIFLPLYLKPEKGF